LCRQLYPNGGRLLPPFLFYGVFSAARVAVEQSVQPASFLAAYESNAQLMSSKRQILASLAPWRKSSGELASSWNSAFGRGLRENWHFGILGNVMTLSERPGC